jgi:hypothetical protein
MILFLWNLINKYLIVKWRQKKMTNETNKTNDELLNAQESADFLKISYYQLLKHIKAGKIKYYKPAGKYYFFKSELINWIKSN